MKPWTLWTVDAHANAKGYWIRLMDGDAYLFLIEISISCISIGTQEFCLPKQDYLIAFKPDYSSENVTYNSWTLPWANSNN